MLDTAPGTANLATAYQEAVRRATEAAASVRATAAASATAQQASANPPSGSADSAAAAAAPASTSSAQQPQSQPQQPPQQAQQAQQAQPHHYINVSRTRKIAQDNLLETLVTALFIAATPLSEDDVPSPPAGSSAAAAAAAVTAKAALEAEIAASRELLENLARHLGFLKVQEVVVRKREPALDTDTFVNAITNVLASEERSRSAMIEPFLRTLFATCDTLLGNTALVSRLPVFDLLITKLCSCCYEREWYSKIGGCQGISIMTSKLDLGVHWMRKHETRLVRALLFVLKDLAPEINVGAVELAQSTLAHVLEACNRRPAEGEPHQEEHQRLFQEIVKLLLGDLANANETVRRTVQSSFQLLSTLSGVEITTMMEPHRERLLSPIFNKPLRALPVTLQVGHLDAITYCLTLKPPLLGFEQQLQRLLVEALSTAESEDPALAEKAAAYKTAPSLTALRVACIEVLTAAMQSAEFHQRVDNDVRNRIIGLYFKSLSHPASEIVEAGRKGLAQSIAQHRLPRELLQTSLRPVLVNLSDPRRLDIHTLQSLSRLLELLVNCFNVALGDKLLEHIKRWVDPHLAGQAPPRLPADTRDIQICVAMLEVYHLLPATAVKFIEPLVTVVLRLEANARRSYSSPFRLPLCKFLNRYPTEAVDFMFSRLASVEHARLFQSMLALEQAAQLRGEIMARSDYIASTVLNPDSPDHTQERLFYGILIVRTVCREHPQWLTTSPQVLEALRALWRRPDAAHRRDAAAHTAAGTVAAAAAAIARAREDGGGARAQPAPGSPDAAMAVDDSLINLSPTAVAAAAAAQAGDGASGGDEPPELLPYPYMHQSRYIADCLLEHCRHQPPQPDILFDLCTVLTAPSTVNYHFIRSYFYHDVAFGATLEQKRAILRAYLDVLKAPTAPAAHKVGPLQAIVIPMVVVACRNGEGPALLDRDVTAELVAALKPEAKVVDAGEGINEMLWIGLLQLLVLLVRYSPQAMHFRADLYNFGMLHHKVEDITAKYAGNVFMSRFIEAFDSPEQMVLQVYYGLLRAHQSEAKVLVNQALDILCPVLARRYTVHGSGALPKWVRLIKKVIGEEGHQLSQLVLLWHLLVRHRDLFYPYRDQFVVPMANSLLRIGFTLSSAPENRKLAVDLCELILQWEKRRAGIAGAHDAEDGLERAPSPPKRARLDGASPASVAPAAGANVPTPTTPNTPSAGSDAEYRPTVSAVEAIVNFLIRSAAATMEPQDRRGRLPGTPCRGLGAPGLGALTAAEGGARRTCGVAVASAFVQCCRRAASSCCKTFCATTSSRRWPSNLASLSGSVARPPPRSDGGGGDRKADRERPLLGIPGRRSCLPARSSTATRTCCARRSGCCSSSWRAAPSTTL